MTTRGHRGIAASPPTRIAAATNAIIATTAGTTTTVVATTVAVLLAVLALAHLPAASYRPVTVASERTGMAPAQPPPSIPAPPPGPGARTPGPNPAGAPTTAVRLAITVPLLLPLTPPLFVALTPPRPPIPPRPPTPPRPKSPPKPLLAGPALQVVSITNAERARAGCRPLRIDVRLISSAQRHTVDMVRRGYFDHDSPNGQDFVDREQAAGYPDPGGENIAYGQDTAAEVMRVWMHSPGHRRNILNCGFTTIGVGYVAAGRYWTQNFGR